MFRKLFQHVIKEVYSCINTEYALSVKITLYKHLCFCRVSFNTSQSWEISIYLYWVKSNSNIFSKLFVTFSISNRKRFLKIYIFFQEFFQKSCLGFSAITPVLFKVRTNKNFIERYAFFFKHSKKFILYSFKI